IAHEPGRQKSFDEAKPELMKTLAKDHADRYRREHVDQLRSMKLDANPDLVAGLGDRYHDEAGKSATMPDLNKPIVPPLVPKPSKKGRAGARPKGRRGPPPPAPAATAGRGRPAATLGAP